MSAELSVLLAFATAAIMCCWLATPPAIVLALRTGFLDHPREYRRHPNATPFLGGAAVLSAFLVAAAVAGAVHGILLVPLVFALGMWLIGTIDDRRPVPPKWRILAALGAAVALNESGLGWRLAGGEAADLAVTALWVVGLVNAFNLMDNLDGACTTVAAVCGGGIGTLALIKGQPEVAALAFALVGACVGFLPWNLAGPARIFLGDGGSMPLGFLVAALAMAAARHSEAGHAGILVGALLAGLPILDVGLVMLSRTRRGVTIVTGGCDHLTHRLLLVLRGPREVAAVLAGLQALLCSLAILGYETGTIGVLACAVVAFVSAVGAILVLDTTRWRPPGIATATREAAPRMHHQSSLTADSG
jgi:UDP-GlcNAc:undecaprenyl-phosphate GlcNAc-1-phosphate transferase